MFNRCLITLHFRVRRTDIGKRIGSITTISNTSLAITPAEAEDLAWMHRAQLFRSELDAQYHMAITDKLIESLDESFRVTAELEEVFDNLADLVGFKAEEQGLELIFDLPAELPMALIGDPVRLGQVLINLCNNAVKFTESGEVVVSATVLEQSDEEALFQFTVKDTGIGMTGEQIAKREHARSREPLSVYRSFAKTDPAVNRATCVAQRSGNFAGSGGR